jgi:hypothetical protein
MPFSIEIEQKVSKASTSVYIKMHSPKQKTAIYVGVESNQETDSTAFASTFDHASARCCCWW